MHNTIDFAKDIYLCICKDNNETPLKEHAEQLFTILKNQPDMQFTLRSQRLGVQAATQIQKRLNQQSMLKIDLFDNHISSTGLSALLRLNFRKINLGCNNLSSEASTIIAQYFSQDNELEALELGIPSGFQFSKYKDSHSPRSLQYNQIGSQVLFQSLHNNLSLKYLGLSYNNLVDFAPQISLLLTRNSIIQAIDLSYCSLQDRGVSVILRGLLQNYSLQYLNLSGNNFTMLSTSILSQILQNKTNLSYLNLNNNAIGSEGAKQLAFGISINKSLRILEIENCALGDEGAIMISQVMTQQVDMGEFEAGENTQRFFDQLCKIYNEISPANGDFGKRITVKSASGCIIKSVQLNKRVTPNIGVRSHRRNFRIQDLDVDQLNFERELHESQALEQSQLQQQQLLDQYYLPPKAQSQRRAFRRSNKTDKSDAKLDLPDDLNPIGSVLQADDISFTDQSDVENSTTQQTTYNYGGIYANEACDSKIAIFNINFSNNALSEKSIFHINKMLMSDFSRIRKIDLSGNKLSVCSCKLLSEAFIQQDINFQNTDFFIFNKNFITIQNENITHLKLNNCYISDLGFLYLSISFARMVNLIAVELQNNFVSKEGQKGIDILVNHESLMSFNVKGNQISYSSYAKLQKQMKNNKDKISLNGPKVLEQRLELLKQDSIRLPNAREELDFLKNSINLVQAYVQQITTQNEDLQDLFNRQLTSQQQRCDVILQDSNKVQGQIEQMGQNGIKLEHQIEVQKESITTQLNQVSLELAQQEQQKIEFDIILKNNQTNLILQKEDIQKQIDSEEQEIQLMITKDQKGKELIEQILSNEKFKTLGARAMQSTSAGKLSLIGDYEPLLTVLRRTELYLANKPIPQPKGYDFNMICLTRLKKSKKGKSKKGKKIVKK
ncbi:Leucine-rich repeat protein [Spironucleus salmonicida]|uniref:LRR-RI domain-containing protein n=1 Tax=Spironucleus salmonicida TaxID=348837 RepID=V6LWD8_9EUKA|nr:Leucine-rich repeat protein [Spironucleus salmonicida]|eukprot:EST48563.1 LRR-RI domain-containing protein [Spironucleus salmonicida]